ncbi:hypothetical protein NYE76_11805 [Paenibacillus sp. FSL M7-0831]|nr:hypothetical protein [Paenibacillus macerans]MEC0333039.1 hypothetical protein [Paenibacillus macerans]
MDQLGVEMKEKIFYRKDRDAIERHKPKQYDFLGLAAANSAA